MKRKATRTLVVVSKRKAPAARLVGETLAKFERTFWGSYYPFGTLATNQFYAKVSPNFGNMPSSTEFAALFDAYKVHKVKVTVIPRFGDVSLDANQTAATIATNNQFYMSVGIDKTGAIIPSGTYGATSYNQFCENVSHVKTFKLDKPFTYSYKPYIMNQNTVSDSTVPCPWITTRLLSQELLGSYVYWHDSNFSAQNASNMAVDFMYTFYFSCKGSK